MWSRLCKISELESRRFVTKDAKMAKYQIKNTKKKIKQLDLLKPLELNEKNSYRNRKNTQINVELSFYLHHLMTKTLTFYQNELLSKVIKIPSGEINNYLMLSRVKLNKHKILISTGMSNLKEITNTLNFIIKIKFIFF